MKTIIKKVTWRDLTSKRNILATTCGSHFSKHKFLLRQRTVEQCEWDTFIKLKEARPSCEMLASPKHSPTNLFNYINRHIL